MGRTEQLARNRIPYAEEYYQGLQYEFDPAGRYRLKPNQKLKHIQVNEVGLRGRSLTGNETVLLLGDSVTFGIGADDDDHVFSRFLESTLEEEVADGSMRAYRVYQHYGVLPEFLKRCPKLKTVVLWFGYADLLYWVLSKGRIEGTFQMDLKYGVQFGAIRKIETLLNKLNIVKKKSVWDDLKKGSVVDLVNHIAGYVDAMAYLCKGKGLVFKVLLQPFIRQGTSLPELKPIIDGYEIKTKEKCGISWYDLSQTYCNLLKDKIDLTDCQSWVQESDFLDQVHMKQDSLDQLAQKVAQNWRVK